MPEPDLAIMGRNELGSYLRDTRESRGLQLDDLVSTTRISKNYLIAIESGDFEKLPNPAYAKGFLRLYAGAVGISGDEVVAVFDRPTTPSKEPEVNFQPASRSRINPASRGRWIMPLVLLALVLFAAFLLQEKESKKAVAPPAPAPKPQPVQAAPALTVQPVMSSARQEKETQPPSPGVSAAEQVPVAPEQKLKGIFLKLKCNQDSSLNITIDDSLSQHYDLKSGDLIEWKAERSFVLDLSNAGGVEAEFNGKGLKPFGAAGASVHVVLNADSVQ